MITLELEKLLQWALREEMPKGHAVSASAWDTISRHAALGVRVDVSHNGGGDGLGFVPGEPHPDAHLVASAVRSLPAETRLSVSDCRALLGHYADLDPLAVQAVAGSAFNMRALVIRCAILGERMPFDVGMPRITPALRHNRQRWAVAFVRDAEGILREARVNGRGNYPQGAATHVVWHEPSIGEVLEARAEYAIWHRALVLVYRDLAVAKMRDYAALPPTSRAVPWVTGQAPEPKVHKGKPQAAAAPLPLSPSRPRARKPLEPDIVTENRREAALRKVGASNESGANSADKIGIY